VRSFIVVCHCDAARVHVMCALIRTASDRQVTISFAFTYLVPVKPRLSGSDVAFLLNITFCKHLHRFTFNAGLCRCGCI